ncbi:Hypothetical protein SRAE_1000132300 [Strongyloides ratti]|uniref:Uncharacterized protein n=1 Tax=Strongyloides ratti TaxID=34506 RepID=A0A090L4K4_STRRB|nr:Hypothetical protein SRAE_1000132300 [Strongyloides ratti]CEF63057.1 Hypothetical protein SRAE_1000132300 [Strongyloides ratti]
MVRRKNKHNITKSTPDNYVKNYFNQVQKNVLNLILAGPGSKLPNDHDEHVMCKFNNTYHQPKKMNLNYITQIESIKTNNNIIKINSIIDDSLSPKSDYIIPVKKRGRPKGSNKNNIKLDQIKEIPQIKIPKKRGRPKKNHNLRSPLLTSSLSIDSSVKMLKIESQSMICHIDDYHPIIALKEVQNSHTISESG